MSIDTNQVSVVGAGLNAKDVSEAPIFTITNLSTTKPVPKEYGKNVQLEFSLSNVVTDSKNNLAVPVQITIPVPNGINPQKFHILHYKTQGGMDVIEPYVFKEKNTWFARFTVNSFSPFVFAELADQTDVTLKGDVNLDGEVNMDDVVALLNHVVKAEIITDSNALAAGEVTNDTELNMDDVVKLLNYVVKAIDSLD